MLNLFEMLANAQYGQGIEVLARKFNLSQQQAQTALEALLPAFSQGLKRTASDPYGIAALMNAMATGKHAKYFEDAARASAPEGVADGNGVLDQIFGSKELSRTIAAQAEQATGIGQEMYKQMLPVVASMIMGGLFKQSSGQLPQSGTNPFAPLLEHMMRQSGMAPPRQPLEQAFDPFDNPFGRALQEMFGSAQEKEAPRQPQIDPYNNPLGRVFQDMLSGAQARHEPEPESRAGPSTRRHNPYDALFGEMFETGRRHRDDYQRSIEALFDRFMKDTAERR
jgi:hypothetical protein